MLGYLQKGVLGIVAQLGQGFVQFLLSPCLAVHLFLALLIEGIALPALLLKMHILIRFLSLTLPFSLRDLAGTTLVFHVQDRCRLEIVLSGCCVRGGSSCGIIGLLLIIGDFRSDGLERLFFIKLIG